MLRRLSFTGLQGVRAAVSEKERWSFTTGKDDLAHDVYILITRAS